MPLAIIGLIIASFVLGFAAVVYQLDVDKYVIRCEDKGGVVINTDTKYICVSKDIVIDVN